MKIKKSHVVLASLVLALGAAVYLNWQLSDTNSLTVADTSRELGAASYVNSTMTATTDEVDSPPPTASKLSRKQSEYFANARMERKKAQDEAVEIAKSTLKLTEGTEQAKEEATEQLSRIEQMILDQSTVETTLKAKGFTDCVCTLSQNACTVIVPKTEVTDTTSLIVKDCVSKTTTLPFDKISIVEV